MTRWAIRAIEALVLLLLATTGSGAQTPKVFRGEITNQNLNCVEGSLKVPEGITAKTKLECILFWTYWKGEPYVLYEPTTKTTYQMDPQDKVIPFIGARVLISGTEVNKKITIEKIEAESNTRNTEKR